MSVQMCVPTHTRKNHPHLLMLFGNLTSNDLTETKSFYEMATRWNGWRGADKTFHYRAREKKMGKSRIPTLKNIAS